MKLTRRKKLKRKKQEKTVGTHSCYVCGKGGADIYVGNGFWRHDKKRCTPGSNYYLKIFIDNMSGDLKKAYQKLQEKMR